MYVIKLDPDHQQFQNKAFCQSLKRAREIANALAYRYDTDVYCYSTEEQFIEGENYRLKKEFQVNKPTVGDWFNLIDKVYPLHLANAKEDFGKLRNSVAFQLVTTWLGRYAIHNRDSVYIEEEDNGDPVLIIDFDNHQLHIPISNQTQNTLQKEMVKDYQNPPSESENFGAEEDLEDWTEYDEWEEEEKSKSPEKISRLKSLLEGLEEGIETNSDLSSKQLKNPSQEFKNAFEGNFGWAD